MRVTPNERPRSYGVASWQAFVAAALFATGALLNGIGRGIVNGNGGVGLSWQRGGRRGPVNETAMAHFSNMTMEERQAAFFNRAFGDEHIHRRWAARKEASGTLIAGHFFSILGWFFSIPPVTSLAHILDDGGARSASMTITYAFVAATVLTMVEFTSETGTFQVSEWMAARWPVLRSPSANDAGELTAAQSFEMTFFMIESRTLWLFALDDILLVFALSAAAFLVFTSKQVPDCLGYLGLINVLVALIDFGFEVSRFVNWRVSYNAAIVTSLLLDAVCMPLWLAFLGVVLRRITLGGGAYVAGLDHGLNGQASAGVDGVEMGAEMSAEMESRGTTSATSPAGTKV